jgi:hypothetical protein
LGRGDSKEAKTNIQHLENHPDTRYKLRRSFPELIRHSSFSRINGAYEAAQQGGLRFTAAKNSARAALDHALRREARYVESMASDNLETLLSSGFFAGNGTYRVSAPLGKPAVTLECDAGTGRMRVKFPAVRNAKMYQVQSSANGNGAWQEVGNFNGTRGILLEQLVPGTVYNVRVRALGGSTGSGDWSDPVSKMAT